jgi:hypothetical protein
MTPRDNCFAFFTYHEILPWWKSVYSNVGMFQRSSPSNAASSKSASPIATVRLYGLCDKEYMSRQYWLTCKDWEEKERGLGNEKNYGYQMMQ